MNKIKGIICLLFALPLFFTACKPADGGDGNTTKLELSANKLSAEVGETLTFTVKFDGKDVTSDATIKDETNGVTLTGNTVKVNTPGNVKFVATYQDNKSNEITVNVTGTNQITLSVDNDVIFAGGDDKATFTVKFNDEDVTADAVITNVTSGQEMAKGANQFSSTEQGTFTFKAEYNEMVSSSITVSVVQAPANPLSIVATKPRIKADGSDFTTFKVMYLNKDVTADAKIKNLSDNTQLSENKFSYSGALKSVKFAAEYDGKTSNTINVGFGDFYKNVMLMRFTATWCAPCTVLAGTLKTVLEGYPDRLVQIAVHSGGGDKLTPSQFSEITSEFANPSGTIPALYFDSNKSLTSGSGVSANTLLSLIKDNQNKGALAGISASSSISGNNAVVTVNVTAAAEGTYYLAAVLVEDGITGYPQTNAPADYVHDNTFRYSATKITGTKLGLMTENQELSKTFTFDLKNYNKDNCRIVCYVSTMKLDEATFTNAISCPINGSTDYRFEE